MPLGNLTSQFFANVYLNELDWFVKINLRAKYYIRYVDDFVILENDREKLECYRTAINEFLDNNLRIELHPEKSKVFCLGNSFNFLGFRVFYHHKLLNKANIGKMKNRLSKLKEAHSDGNIEYDEVYDFLEGWLAYANHANTYRMKKRILKEIEKDFPNEISTKETNLCIKIIKLALTSP